ncbi:MULTISPECIES: hypothetical protein [Methanoculleus]|nr:MULTISPECIES: hypothetical protein [Methanoculleus]UYU19450.1 hypothetical protein OH143_05000 [Methanoculleus submarinus]
MHEENLPMINYFLRNEGFTIPKPIFKQEFLIGLEKAISVGNFAILAKFLRKTADDFEEICNEAGIRSLVKRISAQKKDLEKLHGCFLTSDDLSALQFIVGLSSNPMGDFLEVSGPLYYLSEIASELEKNTENISEIILISSILWVYVNSFELTLHFIDRKLINHIEDKKIPLNRNIKPFYNVERKSSLSHASAERIHHTLCNLMGADPNKFDSILSHSSKTKGFRNKVSHSNLFFDSQKRAIVTLSGEECSISEFLKEYYRINAFLIKWLELSIGCNIDDPEVTEKITTGLKEYYSIYSTRYIKHSRAGLTPHFYNFVVSIRKGKGDEYLMKQRIKRKILRKRPLPKRHCWRK